MNTTHDAIIIGTGQAGPSLANRLADAGHERWRLSSGIWSAAPASTPAASRPRRWSRAPTPRIWRAAPPTIGVDHRWRGSASTWRASRRARTDLRPSRAGPREDADGLANAATSIRGHARSESPHEVAVGETLLSRRPHLHQRRRPRRGAGSARRRHGPFLTNSPMMDLAIAARAPGRRRRQLHRSRVRPDVPPLRQPGHDRRDGRGAHRPGGRGHLRQHPRRARAGRASTFA